MSAAATPAMPAANAGREARPLHLRVDRSLLAVMAVGATAFVYQFINGLAVTGMRNIVMWGQYILFFMFFVGLSAGGLIVASAGRLFGVMAFKPITRLAVLEATIAVILAATFILPDLGRPERILNILLYFNPTSPMIWDIAIVFVYMAMSAFYVWLYARADLSRQGSKLALGTGTSERTMAREERVKTAMAWVALPAAIMLHSITAWIFGLQISRGFWYSSIMAPMFIASALVSGRPGDHPGADPAAPGPAAVPGRPHRDARGTARCVRRRRGFLLLAEYLTALYPGAPEGDAAARMLSGQYLPLFLFEVVVGLLVPFLILSQRRLRSNPVWVGVAAAIGIVGIFVHRLNLVLNGLSYPNIEAPPGLPIGTPQEASFADFWWYVPTLVEWLIVMGILAFGALLFTAAVSFLPMQEPEAH